ncbi:MAG: hypothetical protein R2798_08895 [Chitinophagales bacterium]|nr:hypothetical protein [Bacteroidota bacterium]MCB9043929.1 hypothetical protein [Chitinophagales bacterium]
MIHNPDHFPNPSQPYGIYSIADYDAIVERYEVAEDKDNWVYIEEISNNLLKAFYSCTFVTEYEDYLSGEYERWDDPNRPDTIHFEGSVIAGKR